MCKTPPSDLPSVSILMPLRNAVTTIRRSFRSICEQDYPSARLQLLLIDGESDDGTREELRRIEAISHRERDLPEVRVLRNPARIVPEALNLGLSEASGEIIFRLDAHSLMQPSYVRLCVEKLMENPEVDCVGGPSIARGEGMLGEAYAAALRSPFGVGGGTFRTAREERNVDTVAFGAYRRGIFEELGLFDPELHRNQDIEFNARIRSRGGKLLLITETWTGYLAPSTLGAIIRQNFYNGYWNTKVLGKMWEVLSWRHFLPLMAVLSGFILTGLSPFWPPAFLTLAATALVYVISDAYFALRELSRIGPVKTLLLAALFPVMHMSYGLGSLVGTLAFGWRALKPGTSDVKELA